jgi:hypothetical protein
MPTIPRESVEYLPVTVTRNGVPVTGGVSFALTSAGQRPVEWTPAVVTQSGTAVLVGGQAPGRYNIWARVRDGDEQVVVDAGVLVID